MFRSESLNLSYQTGLLHILSGECDDPLGCSDYFESHRKHQSGGRVAGAEIGFDGDGSRESVRLLDRNKGHDDGDGYSSRATLAGRCIVSYFVEAPLGVAGRRILVAVVAGR